MNNSILPFYLQLWNNSWSRISNHVLQVTTSKHHTKYIFCLFVACKRKD